MRPGAPAEPGRGPLRWLLGGVRDLVLAPICLGCDGAIAAGAARPLVCARCLSRLRPPPPPHCPRCGAPARRTGLERGDSCLECRDWPADVRAARAAVLLLPPADRLVHQLKYRGWSALAPILGERMAAVDWPPDVRQETRFVVPVPTTAGRRRERGYNQAGLLARDVARRTGRALLDVLIRAGASGSQTTLQPAARRANVAGRFAVRDAAAGPILRSHVLLVDDVLTTGATTAECARVLVDAGARCVSVLTFARALEA